MNNSTANAFLHTARGSITGDAANPPPRAHGPRGEHSPGSLPTGPPGAPRGPPEPPWGTCLLYTSDAADDM
eukprot:7408511-Alexandrium_andersonii.AAC.1